MEPNEACSNGDGIEVERDVAQSGRVWVLEGGMPRAVDVRLGVSDGASTEVTGSQLKEGTEVIIGAAGPAAEKKESGGLPRMKMF